MAHIALSRWIGGNNRGRAEKQVIRVEEGVHPPKQGGALVFRPDNIGHRVVQALLDVPDHLRLHLVPMVLQEPGIADGKRHPPQDLESVVGFRQVRMCLLDNGAYFRETVRPRHDRWRLPPDRPA